MSADEKKAKTPSYEALEEAFESVSKKLDHVHFPSTVELNVGGQHFTTSLLTLTKDTGSMLHAMFSGKFDTKPAEDGSYFIDRDGTHFRYILNYLRTGRLHLPADELVQMELLEEAQFYQIRGIVDTLLLRLPQSFLESNILSEEQKDILINTWLEEPLRKPRSSFVLIYRASRDGWASSTFHALCDNKGPTVTVVKSGDNIFGGYTEQSWRGSTGFKRCEKSFLFSLVNQSGAGPTKMKLKGSSNHYGIFCGNSYGPTFGGSHDLYISSDANTNDSSYSNLNNTYECPPNMVATSFLAGGNNELEVFVFKNELA
ncbi:BTB/POZ domain-containing protein KCTD14-like [Montipora foliosa]|uniref:BTB/POZ domain-containing protein KCTD14-like n=1 Tax=Montipora foliosa TaxID=591990 RepID=UPI0035F12256